MSYKHYSLDIDNLVDECVAYGLILKPLGFKACAVLVHSSKRGKTKLIEQINHLRIFKNTNFLINLTVNFSEKCLIIQK